MSAISDTRKIEDVSRWRAPAEIKKERYLDIGSSDPLVESVSLADHEAAHSVIQVGPTPLCAARLRQAKSGGTMINATGENQFVYIVQDMLASLALDEDFALSSSASFLLKRMSVDD